MRTGPICAGQAVFVPHSQRLPIWAISVTSVMLPHGHEAKRLARHLAGGVSGLTTTEVNPLGSEDPTYEVRTRGGSITP